MRFLPSFINDSHPPVARVKADRPIQIDAVSMPHLAEAPAAVISGPSSSKAKAAMPDFTALTPDQVDAYRKGWADGTTTFRNYLDGSIDALRHVIPPQETRDSILKYLPAGLLIGGVAWYGLSGRTMRRNMLHRTAGLNARIDDLERRLVQQVQANGREHKAEIEKLGRTMGDLIERKTVAQPVAQRSQTLPAMAPIAVPLEARLRELEDHITMANKDRRTELNLFRNELHGETSTIKDMIFRLQEDMPDYVEEGIAMHKESEENHRLWEEKQAWKAEAELEAQREMEENPEFFEELEEGAASAAKASSECSEVEANGRARHTIDPEVSGSFTKAETLDPPKLRTYSEYAKDDELEASRKALYDNIQATKDKYQAIMNSVPDNAAGTEASVMAEQLDEAADGIEGQAIGKKKKSQKRKKVAAALTQEEEAEAEQTPSDFSPWIASSASVVPPTATSAAEPILTAEPPAEVASAQQQGAFATSSSEPSVSQGRKKNGAVAQAPRLGVDGSGNWRFNISPQPKLALRAAGPRFADVIYEVKQSHSEIGSFYSFASTSSGSEYFCEIPVYLYPEFDVVRLDGQLWRCERTGPGNYIVREKLSDSSSPEWDGVEFEKD